jgi:hypothetical protein
MGDDQDEAPGSPEVQGGVELLDGQVMDASESALLPHAGEEAAVEPIEEVLGVRTLTSSEPAADELDVTEDALELPEPEDAGGEGHEPNLEEALDRTTLRQDLETRFESLEGERTALDALEPRPTAHAPDELLCSRCHLWRNQAQFVDPTERICRDCA